MKKARNTIRAEDLPTTEELEQELQRVRYRKSYISVMRSTVLTLATVSLISILIAVLLLPVLRIYGSSMSPTLSEGSIVVSLKGSHFKTGDVIAFYYNNKILVKRVIASAGDTVNIDKDGNVYVNEVLMDEPYAMDKGLGECNIDLPYRVPDSRLFVMGDNRSISFDSRNIAIGCVSEEQIVGKIMLCVWPFSRFGKIT